MSTREDLKIGDCFYHYDIFPQIKNFIYVVHKIEEETIFKDRMVYCRYLHPDQPKWDVSVSETPLTIIPLNKALELSDLIQMPKWLIALNLNLIEYETVLTSLP